LLGKLVDEEIVYLGVPRH